MKQRYGWLGVLWLTAVGVWLVAWSIVYAGPGEFAASVSTDSTPCPDSRSVPNHREPRDSRRNDHPDTCIDINHADSAELVELPGIGPVTANRIIAWRAANGLFSDTASLQSVKGIGPKKAAALAPIICFED